MSQNQTVQLYVVGPPVRSTPALSALVSEVLHGFSDRADLVSFQLQQIHGPLTYHVKNAKIPFSKLPKEEQGMWGVDLWKQMSRQSHQSDARL